MNEKPSEGDFEIVLHFHGTPIPGARPRLNRRSGVVYIPSKTRTFVNGISVQAQGELARRGLKKSFPLDCPIEIQVQFRFHAPKSKPLKSAYRFKDRKPDLDNLLKPLKDALEGILWTNDSRIVSVRAEKIECQTEGITLWARKATKSFL